MNGYFTDLAEVYFFDKLPPDIRDRQLSEHEINNINYLYKLQSLEKISTKEKIGIAVASNYPRSIMAFVSHREAFAGVGISGRGHQFQNVVKVV